MSKKIRHLKSKNPVKLVSKYSYDSSLALAWFDPEQYRQLLLVADDPDNLPETFELWEHKAQTFERELSKIAKTEKVFINVSHFSEWCRKHNFQLNSYARSQYAAEQLVGAQ